jgi:hypothetical protein
MQVSDILIGAVAYRLNRSYDAPNANSDKRNLCDYVLNRTKFDTVISERGFNQLSYGMCQLWLRRPGAKKEQLHDAQRAKREAGFSRTPAA